MPEKAAAVEDEAPASPGIASVLPFLYIAWADGLLTPTQIEQIRTRITAQHWLTDEERRRLSAWLDPQNPPDATTYYRWVRTIKESARDIPHAAQKSLAELGCAIASLANVAGPTEEATRALAEMEESGERLGADLLLLKGEVLDRLGQLEEAREAFDRADALLMG